MLQVENFGGLEIPPLARRTGIMIYIAHFVPEKGGWWFGQCGSSSLNGIYYKAETYNSNIGGLTDSVVWADWHCISYSLKKIEMKIRPVRNYYK